VPWEVRAHGNPWLEREDKVRFFVIFGGEDVVVVGGIDRHARENQKAAGADAQRVEVGARSGCHRHVGIGLLALCAVRHQIGHRSGGQGKQTRHATGIHEASPDRGYW
jgi:hypothetical protein